MSDLYHAQGRRLIKLEAALRKLANEAEKLDLLRPPRSKEQAEIGKAVRQSVRVARDLLGESTS